jgi:uncharacterized membrane protein YcaP (DUF421 family)
MFAFETPWWEIIVRVTIIYVAVLILVRITGKRQLGQLAPMDLLTVLLLAETVSPALVGEDFTILGGLVAASTLLALTYANGWAAYRWRSFEAVTEGRPKVLVYDGAIDRAVMRAERVTRQEIETALHRQGLASVDRVALGIIEPDGELTFLERQGAERS